MPLLTTAFAVAKATLFFGFARLYLATMLLTLLVIVSLNVIERALLFEAAEPVRLRLDPKMRSAKGAGVLGLFPRFMARK